MYPKTLGQVAQTPSALELVFRSNVTPEFTIDLSSVVTKQTPPPNAVSSNNATALRFIQPEILIQSLGMQDSIAPYGKPETGVYTYVLGGLASAGLVGAILTFGICRDPKHWIPVTVLVGASFLGFIVYQARAH